MLCVLLCASCASQPSSVPENVTVGSPERVTAGPAAAASDAAPRIVAMQFSSLDVKRPATWSGRIVTSTNVASVELRTNQFTISVPRTAFGDFRFNLNVFDVPSEFVRHYQLRVIARNAAGLEAEEDVPFRIR